MKNNKVVILVTQLEVGGAQAAAIKLLNGLSSEYDAKLVFLYKKTNVLQTSDNLICLADSKPSNIVSNVLVFVSLIKFLFKYKPASMISFGHYSNVFGQLIAFFLGIKNRIASQRNPGDKNPAIMILLDKVFGTIGLYNKNVMVSESVMQSFDTYPGKYLKRCLTIYNGIIKEEDLSKNPKIEDKPEEFKILTVGRLSDEKNQITLIESVRNIENVKLYIAGEGVLRDQITELLNQNNQENVVLLGAVPPNEIPELLISVDLFVLPSLYEGMSNALLEAIVYGLPALVSDIPSHREIFSSDEKANLIDPMNNELWEGMINKLMSDPIILEKIKALSLSEKDRFSYEKMIASFKKLIK